MGNNPLNIIAQMPADEEAEMSVIGSILIDKNAITKVSDFLNPTDFYARMNQEVYAVMLKLEDKGCPIDVLTISNELKKKKVDAVGHLTDCVSGVPTSTHIKEYAKIVKEKHVLRELLATSNDIIEQAKNGEVDSEDLVDMVEQRIFSISQNTGKKKYKSISELTAGAVSKFKMIASGEIKPGIMTGLDTLDEILSGLHKSDMIIVGARPSQGKSALALSIANNVAHNGTPVAMFSLEMSEEQLVERLYSMNSGVGLQQIRNGTFTNQTALEKAIHQIDKVTPTMNSLPIEIDDTPSISVLEIKRACRRIKAEHKELGLVIVDYLQLVRPRKDDGKTNDQVAEISKGLKSLARELDVPVLVLSQLSRLIEQRESSTPRLSDLRDSGAIEQDADVVIFISRGNDMGDGEPPVDLIVSKYRNGPLGTARVKWNRETVSFS
jgi:replicative DNA helicase